MLRESKQFKTCFIFPPHLNSASALPWEIGNSEMGSFVFFTYMLHASTAYTVLTWCHMVEISRCICGYEGNLALH